jgi:inner membrane protein
MLGFSVLSMLPDADVAGLALGVRYGAPWGHRGATHSLAMVVVVGGAVAAIAWARTAPDERGARLPPAALGTVAALVVASHGLLDAMTDGGKGVALLWPWTTRRFFLPWRPIPVAPIGVGFLSAEGLEVAAWEAAVFLPLVLYALWPRRAGATTDR